MVTMGLQWPIYEVWGLPWERDGIMRETLGYLLPL